MSEDTKLSRRERAAQRNAERHKKGTKRKRDDVEEDGRQSQDEVQQQLTTPTDAVEDASLESRGRNAEVVGEEAENEDVGVVSKPKSKKRKKTNKTSATATATATIGDEKTADVADQTNKSRFIVFIGNLPYATTDDSLRAHFKKLAPFELRHRTDPKSKKSKGFAFLEFENYDRMKTCLKLYHHSMFDPAKAGEEKDDEDTRAEKKGKDKGARRINVELTAGGGGKTAGRKEKIKVKNVRLDEQRKRRAEQERMDREKEKAKDGGGSKDAAAPRTRVDDAKDDMAAIHPSRLSRIER